MTTPYTTLANSIGIAAPSDEVLALLFLGNAVNNLAGVLRTFLPPSPVEIETLRLRNLCERSELKTLGVDASGVPVAT